MREFDPAYVGSGSDSAEKPRPRCGRFTPDNGRGVAAPRTAVSCHCRTHAPQQAASLNHLISAQQNRRW